MGMNVSALYDRNDTGGMLDRSGLVDKIFAGACQNSNGTRRRISPTAR
jgi:hypothetical protein